MRCHDDEFRSVRSILSDMVNKEQIRIELANAILNMASRMTSSLLAVRVRLDPPKVAALRNGRLEIFSIERLMHLATKLGHDVEITVRPHPREGHRRARLGVVRVVDLSDPNEISIT
jgi:predicted XRE-type DNA-binding protein